MLQRRRLKHGASKLQGPRVDQHWELIHRPIPSRPQLARPSTSRLLGGRVQIVLNQKYSNRPHKHRSILELAKVQHRLRMRYHHPAAKSIQNLLKPLRSSEQLQQYLANRSVRLRCLVRKGPPRLCPRIGRNIQSPPQTLDPSLRLQQRIRTATTVLNEVESCGILRHGD